MLPFCLLVPELAVPFIKENYIQTFLTVCWPLAILGRFAFLVTRFFKNISALAQNSKALSYHQ
jgi:flagellar biogenesis protein FliO